MQFGLILFSFLSFCKNCKFLANGSWLQISKLKQIDAHSRLLKTIGPIAHVSKFLAFIHFCNISHSILQNVYNIHICIRPNMYIYAVCIFSYLIHYCLLYLCHWVTTMQTSSKCSTLNTAYHEYKYNGLWRLFSWWLMHKSQHFYLSFSFYYSTLHLFIIQHACLLTYFLYIKMSIEPYLTKNNIQKYSK